MSPAPSDAWISAGTSPRNASSSTFEYNARKRLVDSSTVFTSSAESPTRVAKN